jgi:RNA polymerase sigma-70 factor (ECF subfamily)
MSRGLEPDEWLMSQVASDRRDCLAPLVRRYASSLLTFIRRMVGSEHKSEELFQEVFMAVWTKRRLYQYPRPFRPWLFAIAANQCKAAFRSAKPPPVALDENQHAVPLASGPSPVDAAVASETATLVANAVAELPAQQRSVVVLRVWNSLSYAEIGQIVGVSEETARSHMSHGLKALKKVLEPRLREA